MSIEFIEVLENDSGWRYYYKDADAQEDRYVGDSFSVQILPETGMYASMSLYCVDPDDAVGASDMIACEFGFNTYPIDEVTELFNDPETDEGSPLHFEGGPVYEWAYHKDEGGNALEQGLAYIAFDVVEG